MKEYITKAVRQFWEIRAGGSGVLGGKTLDGFVQIIADVVRNSGLTDAQIHTGRIPAQLPGYFRPHKA